MNIEVVYCPRPGHCDRVQLALPEGACVRDAVVASGLCPTESVELVGVWGRKQPLDAALRDRDRVEIYRPLRVDPKEARRQRYKRAKAGKPEAAK